MRKQLNKIQSYNSHDNIQLCYTNVTQHEEIVILEGNLGKTLAKWLAKWHIGHKEVTTCASSTCNHYSHDPSYSWDIYHIPNSVWDYLFPRLSYEYGNVHSHGFLTLIDAIIRPVQTCGKRYDERSICIALEINKLSIKYSKLCRFIGSKPDSEVIYHGYCDAVNGVYDENRLFVAFWEVEGKALRLVNERNNPVRGNGWRLLPAK